MLRFKKYLRNIHFFVFVKTLSKFEIIHSRIKLFEMFSKNLKRNPLTRNFA